MKKMMDLVLGSLVIELIIATILLCFYLSDWMMALYGGIAVAVVMFVWLLSYAMLFEIMTLLLTCALVYMTYQMNWIWSFVLFLLTIYALTFLLYRLIKDEKKQQENKQVTTKGVSAQS